MSVNPPKKFLADRIPPPPRSGSVEEMYRWNYRVFELLNGIQLLSGDGIEPTSNLLMHSDDNSSRVGILEDKIKKIEEIMLLQDVTVLEEVRKELNEIKKLIVMEV